MSPLNHSKIHLSEHRIIHYLPVNKIFGGFNARLILHYSTKALKGMSKGDGGKLCKGISGFTIAYSGLCFMGKNFSENLENRVSWRFCVCVFSIPRVAWKCGSVARVKCLFVWSFLREIYNLFYLCLLLWYLKQAWQYGQKANVNCHEKAQIDYSTCWSNHN